MWKKPTDPKEIAKQQQRDLKGTTKELERDLAAQDREMSKLEAEIKQAAKRGDEAGARILAKQLLRMREQRTRSLQVKGQVTSTSYAAKSASSQYTLAMAMASTTAAMGQMNKAMPVAQMQKMANAFETESAKMEMTSEMMDETMDSIFEGDEETESNIMNQIYDEIGLEVAHSTPNTPSHIKSTAVSDDAIEAFIKSQMPAN